MKQITYFFALLMLTACADQTTKVEEPPTTTTVSTEDSLQKANERAAILSSKEHQAFLGAYVGMFEGVEVKKDGSWVNKINISIDKIDNGKIYGHSVVAGNDRRFEGTFDPSGTKIEVKEPGDDKYDGVFVLNFNAARNGLSGTWAANDSKLKVTNRTFELEKKKIAYNKDLDLPEDVLWEFLYDNKHEFEENEGEMLTGAVVAFNASNTVLKKEDIENMYKGDLEVMRNAIYARHGYSFKNRKMRYVFDQVDWYIPVHTDVRSDLTDLEKKNIDLLKRYEGHAGAYYDSFGR